MDLEDVIRRRRMMRNFAGTPVPFEVVEHMIDLARRSPSAGFSQGVDFVVLCGPEETSRFWDVPSLRAYWDREFPGVVRAPVIVLPIADRGAYLRRYSEPDKVAAGLQEAAAWPVPYWLVDTAMATMTLLLAAVDAGLAALFFGLFRGTDAEVLERLEVPSGHELIGVVAMGNAAGGERTGSPVTHSRRPLSEVIHRGGW
jgi:nitroreductase